MQAERKPAQAPETRFSVNADRQIELLTTVSFAVGYLDAYLRDNRSAIPQDRRSHIAGLVTKLEAARDAVRLCQKVEFSL